MVGEDGRLYLPEAFLGAARRAGLAHEIDRWVVRQAIGLIHANEQAERDVRVEVNLSPEAIDDRDLIPLIEEEIAATGIDPANLILEVTGAAAISDLEGAKKLAKSLRALGCRFALDDFQSTFGSFRYLKELPIDYLKLDGELITSLAESKTSELIIKALVDVARGTATKTVAVFVSDDETLELLRALGVDFAQGYAVGRPRPAADVWPSGPAELPAGD
jgi:EAL domain-containing protein (putative c-di-GMP-specific phosphodiesterase class I)